MNKIAIFAVAVFLGVVGFLVLSNQQSSKPATSDIDFSLSPTGIPTLAVDAQTEVSPAAQTTPAEIPSVSTATIKTSKGDIVVELYSQDAPNTVANFAQKAASDYYKNLTFHRVEDWVVQGGDPKGNGTGGGSMPTELNQKPFVIGSLGVARAGDIKVSNDSQFFITKKDSSFLNGQYTNFGMVTAGMNIVDKMAIGDKILGITVE